MRHAKSDWGSDALRDFDRPLSRRGQQDAPRMGRWLREQGCQPERVICSPALRTRETAKLVMGLIGFRTEDVIHEPMIYEAGLQDLLTALHTHAGNANTLMLIGHNPGLDELVRHLADRPPLRSQTGKLMTTAAVAVLRFTDWRLVQSSGELIEIMRPGMLKQD